jgi:hypothetical protein
MPECYLNCDLHFVTPSEKEYCFVNMCNCIIISKYDSLQKILYVTNFLLNNNKAEDNSRLLLDKEESNN